MLGTAKTGEIDIVDVNVMIKINKSNVGIVFFLRDKGKLHKCFLSHIVSYVMNSFEEFNCY